MKFMASWRLHEDNRHETFQTFSAMSPDEDAADHGPNIKVIGRWHDLALGAALLRREWPDLALILLIAYSFVERHHRMMGIFTSVSWKI